MYMGSKCTKPKMNETHPPNVHICAEVVCIGSMAARYYKYYEKSKWVSNTLFCSLLYSMSFNVFVCTLHTKCSMCIVGRIFIFRGKHKVFQKKFADTEHIMNSFSIPRDIVG